MDRGEAVQRSDGHWTYSAVRVQTECVRQGAGVHAGAAPRARSQVRIQPIERTRIITLIRSKSRANHTTNFVIPEFPLVLWMALDFDRIVFLFVEHSIS